MNESKKILAAADATDADAEYTAEYTAYRAAVDATDAAERIADAAYEAERTEAYYAAKNAAFQSAIEGGQEFFLADKWGRYAGAELQPYYSFIAFPTSDGFELCPLPIFGAMAGVDSADLGLYESEGAVLAENIEAELSRRFGAQYAGPAYWLEYSVGWTVLSPEDAALAAADDNTRPAMEADELPKSWQWSEDKWGKEELEDTPYGVALRKLRNAAIDLDDE